MDNEVKITGIYYFEPGYLCSGGNIGILYSKNGSEWLQSNLTDGDFRIGVVDKFTKNVACAIRIGDDKKFYSINGKDWVPAEDLIWDITIKDPFEPIKEDIRFKTFIREKLSNLFNKLKR